MHTFFTWCLRKVNDVEKETYIFSTKQIKQTKSETQNKSNKLEVMLNHINNVRAWN